MAIRSPLDQRGSLPAEKASLVDTQVGDAYPHVKKVAEALQQILYVAENLHAVQLKDVEFNNDAVNRVVQWRYVDETVWRTLVTYADLLGEDVPQLVADLAATLAAAQAAEAAATQKATEAGASETEATAQAGIAYDNRVLTDQNRDSAIANAQTATDQATLSTEQAVVSTSAAELAKKWATQTLAEVVAGEGFGAKKYAEDAAASATVSTDQANISTTAAGTSLSHRDAAEGFSLAADQDRQVTEQHRIDAEGFRDTALTARDASITARDTTFGYRNEAEGFKDTASGAATVATTKRDEAQAFRNEAEVLRNETQAATSSVVRSLLDPVMDGVVAPGVSEELSRADHVHPIDTSRAAAADLTAHTGATGNVHGLTPADINLGNVDNISDVDKPVSTPQQVALDLKANAANAALTGQATAESLSIGNMLELPEWTTATRPANGNGRVGFNTDLSAYEGFNGTTWSSLGGGAEGPPNNPSFYAADQTLTASHTLTAGRNYMTPGPYAVGDGAVLTIEDGVVWTIV